MAGTSGLRWSVIGDDDGGDVLEMTVPVAVLGSRRRAVDASDLRRCALVQTMMKSSPAYSGYRYVHTYQQVYRPDVWRR